MNRFGIYACGLFSLLLSFTSCDGQLELYFRNDSDRRVVVFMKEEFVATWDTLLPADINMEEHFEKYPDATPNGLIRSYPHTTLDLYFDVGRYGLSWDYYFDQRDIDTLHLFVLNEDTLMRYGWNGSLGKYVVLQRYDLSTDDLYYFKGILVYPPTPEMGRYIKMWPPYNFDE